MMNLSWPEEFLVILEWVEEHWKPWVCKDVVYKSVVHYGDDLHWGHAFRISYRAGRVTVSYTNHNRVEFLEELDTSNPGFFEDLDHYLKRTKFYGAV